MVAFNRTVWRAARGDGGDLAELRNAHLVYSRKGKTGGYALSKPASDITVGQIVRVLDGPLAPLACASVTAYRPCHDCSDETICAVRLMMQEARDALANVLDHRSLAQMRDAALSPVRALERLL